LLSPRCGASWVLTRSRSLSSPPLSSPEQAACKGPNVGSTQRLSNRAWCVRSLAEGWMAVEKEEERFSGAAAAAGTRAAISPDYKPPPLCRLPYNYNYTLKGDCRACQPYMSEHSGNKPLQQALQICLTFCPPNSARWRERLERRSEGSSGQTVRRHCIHIHVYQVQRCRNSSLLIPAGDRYAQEG